MVCISDTRRCDPTGRSDTAPVFTDASFGITASVPSHDRCRPSPCARALPGSEYYGGSAPSRPDRSTVDPAPNHHAGSAAAGRKPRRFPCSLTIHSTKEEPNSVPAASPRLPRSTSPWPPTEPPMNRPGVPRPPDTPPTAGARRSRPTSARFRAGSVLRDFATPVPLVLLSVTLAEPAPSGSTSTPRRCQDCSRPPRHLPDQAVLSFTALLRQDGGGGLSPPLESTAPHGAPDGTRSPS